MMTDPQQLASLIRDVLHDRLENSTKEHIAVEAATLRGYMFATLDAIDHIRTHVEHDEIVNKAQMLDTLAHLMRRIENNMANLEDVRLELRRAHEQ